MKKSVAIIGGGAAAIACAAFLDKRKFNVTIYEKNKALGRKFLVAGKGGFNLTHSEQIHLLSERYTPTDFLKTALLNFSNDDFRTWLHSIGVKTYVGSSKRVYPTEGIKPIEVLKAMQSVLHKNGVDIQYNTRWNGWDSDGNLKFKNQQIVTSDLVVFALGGGSWKVTGSDGSWSELFQKKGVNVLPFQASNCAFKIDWKENFIEKHSGSPLKNIAISCSGKQQKGEVVVTKFGLEGNAIYAMSPEIRAELLQHQTATISIDLKPSLAQKDIEVKLIASKAKNATAALKHDLKLSPAQIALLKTYVPKEAFLDNQLLALNIKDLKLAITSAGDIDEAISTVGGISIDEMDSNYQLRTLKNTFCIGEMVDWDAPTGGYLLQACFSMGVGLARYINTCQND